MLQAAGCSSWAVALSGGPDSASLLQAMHSLQEANLLHGELRAVHVDHGRSIKPSAGMTLEQVALAQAQRLGVPCEVLRSSSPLPQREVPTEADMRTLRYDLLRPFVQQGEGLLTAHQSRDQAETYLLRLLRGSAIRGLSAMRTCQPFGSGSLVRPLLDTDVEALHTWAEAAGAQWVQDPSNEHLRHDRNFVRKRVLPTLQARWPRVISTLIQAAEQSAQASDLLDILASEDWQRLRLSDDECAGSEYAGSHFFNKKGYFAMSLARRRNMLRSLCASMGWAPPPRRCLEQDEALRTGRGVLRWRDWSEGTVAFGSFRLNDRRVLYLRLEPLAEAEAG